jgi:hypothetical protein
MVDVPIAQRPGCAEGVRVPHEINYNEPDEDNVGTFVNSMQSVLVRSRRFIR